MTIVETEETPSTPLVSATKPRRRALRVGLLVTVLIAAGAIFGLNSTSANAELIVQNAAQSMTTATATSYTLSGTFMSKGMNMALGSFPLTGEGYVQAKPRLSYLSMSMSALGQSFGTRMLVNSETGQTNVATNLGGAWSESTQNYGSISANKYSALTGPLESLAAGGFSAQDKGTDADGHRYDFSGTIKEMLKATEARKLSPALRKATQDAIKKLKGGTLSGSLWIDDATGHPVQMTTIVSLGELTGSITQKYHDWNVIKDPAAMMAAGR